MQSRTARTVLLLAAVACSLQISANSKSLGENAPHIRHRRAASDLGDLTAGAAGIINEGRKYFVVLCLCV